MTDQKILVYGTKWCPDCTRAKGVFNKLNIAFEWFDTDVDKDARAFRYGKESRLLQCADDHLSGWHISGRTNVFDP